MELDIFIASLDEDQKDFLEKLSSNGDGFSVDSFPNIPSSKMTGIVLKLYMQKWITILSP